MKDEGHLYFIRFLSDPEEGTTAQTRAQAAFVLATICVGVASPSRPPGSCDPAQQVRVELIFYIDQCRSVCALLPTHNTPKGGKHSQVAVCERCSCWGRRGAAAGGLCVPGRTCTLLQHHQTVWSPLWHVWGCCTGAPCALQGFAPGAAS